MSQITTLTNHRSPQNQPHYFIRTHHLNKRPLCWSHQNKGSINQDCHKRFYRHMFFWFKYFFTFETSATASCGYMLYKHIYTIGMRIRKWISNTNSCSSYHQPQSTIWSICLRVFSVEICPVWYRFFSTPLQQGDTVNGWSALPEMIFSNCKWQKLVTPIWMELWPCIEFHYTLLGSFKRNLQYGVNPHLQNLGPSSVEIHRPNQVSFR